MYKESLDCPGGMLALELEELLLLHAKNTSTAATLDAAVSHLVTVFMLCSLWIEIHHRVEDGCQKPFQNPTSIPSTIAVIFNTTVINIVLTGSYVGRIFNH
jgi:hypothetical protein